jgi:hypothetical protein
VAVSTSVPSSTTDFTHQGRECVQVCSRAAYVDPDLRRVARRGYDGGYDAVRRYARRWAKERGQSTAAAYVPLSFAPGEAYQFDWSHEVAC